jgi:hypothetical protein
MGLLDHYRAKSKGEWTAAESPPLEFDFGQNALSGVKLRDPASCLWRFGPPEDGKRAGEGAACFYSRGFEVNVRRGRVEEFVLFWRGTERFQPFAGLCRLGEAEIKLSAGVGEHEIIRIFGAPFWRDEDADEILLFYEHKGAVEWQVEIDRQTGLSAMVVTALPLLADAKQRQAYRVSKPWPPEMNG